MARGRYLPILTGNSCPGRCRWRLGRGPVLQTYSQNVSHIPQISAYQLQAAIAVVAPTDRHLVDGHSKVLRKNQNLHVEHITVDFLMGKDFLGGIVLKELEAALGVGDGSQSRCKSH